MDIEIEKSSKGVYKDFEDFLKQIVLSFNVKDKLNFRKDLEMIIKTIKVSEEIDFELYKNAFLELLKKYGGKK